MGFRPFNLELAHVRYVEDPSVRTDGTVLRNDTVVLDRHLPAREGNKARTEGDVAFVEGRSAQRLHDAPDATAVPPADKASDGRRCRLDGDVAEVLLFHHAQGLTPGVLSFADELRAGGHVVHAPDLYDGKTFTDLNDGVGYAREVGFDTIAERGRLAAEGLPNDIVYAGFSLGAMPAQMLAQTRAGSKGALLFSSAIPASEFGSPWPQGVPLQIHLMEADEWALEGDLDAARELDETVESAELFLYPGDRHLFADNSLADYDQDATALLTRRVLTFLDDVE